MIRWFSGEYRRHPYWALALLLLLFTGLVFDFTILPELPAPSSPTPGVLPVPGSIAQPEPGRTTSQEGAWTRSCVPS